MFWPYFAALGTLMAVSAVGVIWALVCDDAQE